MGQRTILVTGGCGYIGSHVVRMLSERGDRVIVLDDLSKGFREALIHGEELIVGNVGDEALLDRLFSDRPIEAVIHFAAALVVPESVVNPVKYYTNNTMNTLRLVSAIARHKIPNMVFSSTAATYGQVSGKPVTESAPVAPESPYGASKAMSERMIQDIGHAHKFTSVILRYFNVAGADPEGRIGQRTPEATHLIKVAAEAATGKRKGMEIFGTDYPTQDGTCIRDYIHVEDLADAHLRALDWLQKGGASQLFNCGYGHGSSVRQVIKAMQEVSKVNFKVTESPRRPGDVAEIVANADKIKSVLGWKPRFADLKTIVEHAYRWEKKLG